METQIASCQASRLAERAYEAFAPLYDDFTEHHDYELWLGNLLPELRRFGLYEDSLLDVGCGTGKSFLPMLEWGWHATACDISPSMVDLARAKAGDRAQILVADMRRLPLLGAFDLVWALDDAINYLLNARELAQALAGMRVNLAPDGLMAFDVNTLASYRTFFAETVQVEGNGRALIWRGQSTVRAQPGSINDASFEVAEAENGGDAVEICIHRQRHFPEAEVLRLIEDSGLECLAVYGHGYDAVFDQPLDELAHTKAVYIARRHRANRTGQSPRGKRLVSAGG